MIEQVVTCVFISASVSGKYHRVPAKLGQMNRETESALNPAASRERREVICHHQESLHNAFRAAANETVPRKSEAEIRTISFFARRTPYTLQSTRFSRYGPSLMSSIEREVLSILDEVLSLRGRGLHFTSATQLLGAVPELDSMAVVGVITAIEERFDITVEDDDLDGATFETVGSLVGFVNRKLEVSADR